MHAHAAFEFSPRAAEPGAAALRLMRPKAARKREDPEKAKKNDSYERNHYLIENTGPRATTKPNEPIFAFTRAVSEPLRPLLKTSPGDLRFPGS